MKDTNNVTKQYAIMDVETGQIIKVYKKNLSKQEKLEETYSEDNDLLIPWRTNTFTKLYSNEILPEYNTEKFLIYWIKLSKKLSFATNIIVHKGRGKGNDTPMTKEDMCKFLNVSERTLRNFINESKEKNIIVENVIKGDITRVQYVLNPIYTFSGNNINYYTFELFKHDPIFNSRLTKKMIEHYNYLASNRFNKPSEELLPLE